jgi:hypothetical protein
MPVHSSPFWWEQMIYQILSYTCYVDVVYVDSHFAKLHRHFPGNSVTIADKFVVKNGSQNITQPRKILSTPYFLKSHFNIIIPSMSMSSKWSQACYSKWNRLLKKKSHPQKVIKANTASQGSCVLKKDCVPWNLLLIKSLCAYYSTPSQRHKYGP